MKIGFWNYYEQLSTNNFMFTHPDAPIGDKLLLPFNMLYQQAKTRGIQCMTLDLIDDWSGMDAFVFMDMPPLEHPLVRRAFATHKPRFLVTWENPIIKPDNWISENHHRFDGVFTWADELARRDDYYVKINYPHLFPPAIGMAGVEKTKLCAMIACNKDSADPRSLYGARRAAIDWFEQHAPNDFDLYGFGWLEQPSYRGAVRAKKPTLARYYFSICYENARFPGYITEKIFDCFFAGCVPVYLGAPNVLEHIPADCFVNADHYRLRGGSIDYPLLHRHLQAMAADGAWAARHAAIEAYLRSEQAQEFSAQRFVDTMIKAFGG